MAAFVNALADSGSDEYVTDTDTHTKRKLKIQKAVETNWKNLHFTVHLVFKEQRVQIETDSRFTKRQNSNTNM